MTAPRDNSDASRTGGRRIIRFAIIVLAAITVPTLLMLHWTESHIIQNIARRAIELAASLGWKGYGLMVCIQVLACLTSLLPASLIAATAGGLYGVTTGFLISFTGLLIAACIAFWLGRSLLREWAAERLFKQGVLGKLDADIGRGGWKLVFMLRLSPISPFGATSYALALTRIKTRDYLIGTIASSCALIAYVYTGDLMGRSVIDDGFSLQSSDFAKWSLILLSLIAAAGLFRFFWVSARQRN